MGHYPAECQADRDAIPDDHGGVADENVLDDEAHDSLALIDVKRVGGAAQMAEECPESLGKVQGRWRSAAWPVIACNSARSACSRCRSEGIRSPSCLSDKSSS